MTGNHLFEHQKTNNKELLDYIESLLFKDDTVDLVIKCGSVKYPVHTLIVRRNQVLAEAIERLANTINPPIMVVSNDRDETIKVLELPEDNSDALWELILDLYGFEYDGSDAHFRPHVNAYLLAKKYRSRSLQRSVVAISNHWIETLEDAQEDDDIDDLATDDFEAVKILFENTADGDVLRLKVLDCFAAQLEFLKVRYAEQINTLLTGCAAFNEARLRHQSAAINRETISYSTRNRRAGRSNLFTGH